MHIAYSATRTKPKRSSGIISADQDKHLADSYCGYLAACRKHRETIAAIQKYLPGWEPQPPGPPERGIKKLHIK